MQVDMGEKSIVMSDQSRMKVYFVSFVLCYSRMMYIHYSTRAYNTDMFIAAHLAAFQYFGGVPQAGIYDQTKLYQRSIGKFFTMRSFRDYSCV